MHLLQYNNFFSLFALGKAEENYYVTRGEFIAVVKVVSHFKLYGDKFRIKTDHA